MFDEAKKIKALLLSEYSDVDLLNRGDESDVTTPFSGDTHPFNDNGGDPDGGTPLLRDYTDEEKEILIANGAKEVDVYEIEYTFDEDDEGDEYGDILEKYDWLDEYDWLGMQIEELAWVVIPLPLASVRVNIMVTPEQKAWLDENAAPNISALLLGLVAEKFETFPTAKRASGQRS